MPGRYLSICFYCLNLRFFPFLPTFECMGYDATMDTSTTPLNRPSLRELTAFFEREFPQLNAIRLEELGPMTATVRHAVGINELRPGNTVAGPVMMAAADAAIYAALLGEIGFVALAVTTGLNINFLRKPAGDRDIIARCQLLKIGRALAVGEVSVYSEGHDEPVAHAVGTYSIPPDRS